MGAQGRFEDLIAEAQAAPIEGWSFEWLMGRATEERPPWGFAALLAERLGTVESVLDLQTGGGEFLAEVLDRAVVVPERVTATEGWLPNAAAARRT